VTDFIRFYDQPELNNPQLITAWPGIGDVSLIVGRYLRQKLSFRELGEVEAGHFFDPTGVIVRDNIVEAPRFPQSKFYYYKNSNAGDIILFVGDQQPLIRSYELAECVLEAVLELGVRCVYTLAAALTRMHYSETSRVWAVGTNKMVLDKLNPYNLPKASNVHISGLNGLLLGIAKERNVDGICLLGEVPNYFSQMKNPMAALAVINVLQKMLNIDVDTNELRELAEKSKEQMKQVMTNATESYIGNFTEPIWESDSEKWGDE
jgi:proteasome assembly chaperone (PAC2) family protein